MTTTAEIALESLKRVPDETKPMVVGFDGFVDEMISVVEERQSL